MKRFAVLSLIFLRGAASFAADAPLAAVAPPEIPELLPKKIGKMTAVIKLKNVRPTIMLQWLDPKDHPPTAMDCGGVRPTDVSPPKSSNAFELPDGVEKLEAIEEQNSVLARGTIEAIEELQKLIQAVDQPRKVVELEVALYTTDAETVRKLDPQNFAPLQDAKPESRFGVTYVGKSIKVINEAIAANQARLLKTEKLRTFNNLAICSETKFPINDALELIKFQLSLVPTINGDGTITVLAAPLIERSKSVEGRITTSNTKIQTALIMHDDDSAALGYASATQNSPSWICIVTPHLLKENAVTPQK